MVKRDPIKRAKLPAVLVAIFVTLLTSTVAGLLVGLCFSGTFWHSAIGIACISRPYILMDRVQSRTRFFPCTTPLDNSIDGDFLVIARTLTAVVVVRREKSLTVVSGDVLSLLQSLPQFRRCREVWKYPTAV